MPEEQTEQIYTKFKRVLGLKRYFLKKRFMILFNFYLKKYLVNYCFGRKIYFEFCEKTVYLKRFFLNYLNRIWSVLFIKSSILLKSQLGRILFNNKINLSKTDSVISSLLVDFLFNIFYLLIKLIKCLKISFQVFLVLKRNKFFFMIRLLQIFNTFSCFVENLFNEVSNSANRIGLFYKIMTEFVAEVSYLRLLLQKMTKKLLKKYFKLKFFQQLLLLRIRKIYKQFLRNPFFVSRISHGRENFWFSNRYNLKVLGNFFTKYLYKFSIDTPFFQNKPTIFIRTLNKLSITSSFLARYLSIKLLQRHRLMQTLHPVFKDLRQNSRILGYRVACSGRFTKKEIATYQWFQAGSLPTNKLRAHLDYAFLPFIMKYSVCCFKVWLHNLRSYLTQKRLFIFFYKQIDIISGKKKTSFSSNNRRRQGNFRVEKKDSKKKEVKKYRRKKYLLYNTLRNLKLRQIILRKNMLFDSYSDLDLFAILSDTSKIYKISMKFLTLCFCTLLKKNYKLKKKLVNKGILLRYFFSRYFQKLLLYFKRQFLRIRKNIKKKRKKRKLSRKLRKMYSKKYNLYKYSKKKKQIKKRKVYKKKHNRLYNKKYKLYKKKPKLGYYKKNKISTTKYNMVKNKIHRKHKKNSVRKIRKLRARIKSRKKSLLELSRRNFIKLYKALFTVLETNDKSKSSSIIKTLYHEFNYRFILRTQFVKFFRSFKSSSSVIKKTTWLLLLDEFFFKKKFKKKKFHINRKPASNVIVSFSRKN
jgi:ribosomal protein S3